MKKVAGIWRMSTMFLFGIVFGMLLSYSILNKVTAQSEGQNITIGRLKIKNSSEIEDVINIDQDSRDDNSKKKRLFNKRK